jgi:hypothetical protein
VSSAGQAPICVLGASRSGTSLTARVLNLAGVYLGAPEDLLGGDLSQIPVADRTKARVANQEGFWEHYRLMRLNERILRRFGGNWCQPPVLPQGWQESAALEHERQEAQALIAETFAGRDLWGWKDPRNSLTLPFWRRLLPDLRCVVCLRNPVDVGASLGRRDGLASKQALDLWLAYVAAALVNTSGRPRLFVSYERYFDDPAGTAARLARFAGRDGALDAPGARRQLAEAVDERLWRNRTSLRDAVGAAGRPSQIAALHLITELLAAAGAEDSDATAELGAAVDLYAEGVLAAYDRSRAGGAE